MLAAKAPDAGRRGATAAIARATTSAAPPPLRRDATAQAGGGTLQCRLADGQHLQKGGHVARLARKFAAGAQQTEGAEGGNDKMGGRAAKQGQQLTHARSCSLVVLTKEHERGRLAGAT